MSAQPGKMGAPQIIMHDAIADPERVRDGTLGQGQDMP